MASSTQKQLSREAKWAVYLTLFYLLGWILCAYFAPTGRGALGFPLWFELSCIYLPILFIFIAFLTLKVVYREISLDEETQKQGNDQ